METKGGSKSSEFKVMIAGLAGLISMALANSTLKLNIDPDTIVQGITAIVSIYATCRTVRKVKNGGK